MFVKIDSKTIQIPSNSYPNTVIEYIHPEHC